MTSLKTVLVVDDEAHVRERVSKGLREAGFQVSCAANGGEALARAAAEPPDLLLLDVMMPGLDGFEVFRRLKSDPRTAAVPVISLIGRMADVEAAPIEAWDDGEYRWMVKPFSPRTLLDVLRHLFDESREVEQTWMVETPGYRALGQHSVILRDDEPFVAMGAVGYPTCSYDPEGNVRMQVGKRRVPVPGVWRHAVSGRAHAYPVTYLPVRALEDEGLCTVRLDRDRLRLEIGPGSAGT